MSTQHHHESKHEQDSRGPWPLIVDTVSSDLHRVRARGDFTVENNAGSQVSLVVAVYSRDKVNGLVPGDRILVLGHATSWEWSNGKTVEIRFDVEHAWQIARY